MAAQNPDNAPAATPAKTTKSADDNQECRWCGWPFGPDLTQQVIDGALRTVCKNPWRCQQRDQDLGEFLEVGPLTRS